MDSTIPVRSLLASYGLVVAEWGDERSLLRSLPWVYPQAGSSPGDTALLPTPAGRTLLYDADGGFRYISAPGVTTDDLLRFAREYGG